LRVAGKEYCCWLRVARCLLSNFFSKLIIIQSFTQDTHDLDRSATEEHINAYNSLGKKIFAFTNYIEKDWK
jgi:hypothetical protein